MNDELIDVSKSTRWAYTAFVTEYTVRVSGVVVLKSETSGDDADVSELEATVEIRRFLKRLALSALDEVL